MSVFQAFILGIVQGVTEFLPISSSGFLILIPEWFGWEVQSLAFDVIVHVGTLFAVLIAFRNEIVRIVSDAFLKPRSPWGRLGWLIVLATIPVLIVGAFGGSFIEAAFRSKTIVAVSFIVWGAVLLIADRVAREHTTDVREVTTSSGVFIGIAQVLALIPGTSRSGITITAGLFSGLSREAATRFSFLLAIPTIVAAGALKTFDLVSGSVVIEMAPLVVGFLTSFVTAWIVIVLLIEFVKRYSYTELAIFRILIGVLILL